VAESDKDVVIGPLFSLGAVLLLVAAMRRSARTAVVGSAAIAADFLLPPAVALKRRLRDRRPRP